MPETSIGQRFTQLIQHLGISKNAFAMSLDKTATVIQHLVDERNKPGFDLLCKVFEVYPNVSKDWLMEGRGPMLSGTTTTLAPAIAVPATAPTPSAPAPALAPEATPPPVSPAPVARAPSPASAALAEPAVLLPSPTSAPATPVALPPPAAAPDSAYLTAALQTQYLQHQLALAEQRNQHLLEQQALMQQLVAVLQRAV